MVINTLRLYNSLHVALWCAVYTLLIRRLRSLHFRIFSPLFIEWETEGVEGIRGPQYIVGVPRSVFLSAHLLPLSMLRKPT